MSIQKGSRGTEVNKLQQQLIDAGFLAPQYNTGYFGDLTDSALRKFQASKGLPVGTYDVVTQKALNLNAATPLEQNPNIIGTDLGEYLMGLKKTNPTAYYTLSEGANTGMITPGMVKYATDTATQPTERYYAEDRLNSRSALDNYLRSSLGDYERVAGDLQSAGVADFNTLNDNEGKSGTWASSARGDRMKSLESGYRSKFQDLYSKSLADLQSKLQGQEYNYGAENTPTASLNSYTPNFTTTPSFQSTSSNIYNPFNFVGRKNAERAAGIQAGTNEILSTQFKPLTIKTNN
jgi:peptidoglycan hydrolase-like protein with peptidoglycan-binding domain